MLLMSDLNSGSGLIFARALYVSVFLGKCCFLNVLAVWQWIPQFFLLTFQCSLFVRALVLSGSMVIAITAVMSSLP